MKNSLRILFFGRDFSNGTEAVEVKELVAQIIIALSFLQFLLGSVLYGYLAYNAYMGYGRNELNLVTSTTLLVSSIIYALLGSILFKTNSRIYALIVFLISVVSLGFVITAPGIQIHNLINYGLLSLICGRALYAVFLIHKKWPEQINVRNRFPRWFYILYIPLGLFFIVIAGLLLYGKYFVHSN